MQPKPRKGLLELLFPAKSKPSGGDPSNYKMCPSCGKFVDKNARICEYCGAELYAKPRVSNSGEGEPLSPVMIVFMACILIYVVSIVLSGKMADYNLASNFWGPNGEVLGRMGSNIGALTFGHYEVWRLITYMFLHGGLMHIFFNLMALAQLGPLTFQNFGARRFWLIVFITGIAGGAFSAFASYFYSRGASVGFSGVLFGMLGVNWVYLKRHQFFGEAQRLKNYMVWGNVIFIALELFGLFPVDNLAHLGGMFAGIGMGYLLLSRNFNFLPTWLEWGIVAIMVLVWVFGLYQSFLYIDARFG